MTTGVKVALIGDRSEAVLAHTAIPISLELAGARLECPVTWDWLPTASFHSSSHSPPAAFPAGFDCAWCVPGSPYESEEGALDAIRLAREFGIPFLGTCGGCQHAILEYARNVLGIRGAEHAETHPLALLPLIAPLSCALVETTGAITLERDSMICGIYGRDSVEESYHCSYGLNPKLEHLLAGSPMRITARDRGGEARVELAGHRFYLLTQFQPERSALAGTLPPIAAAFIAAARDHMRTRPTFVQ